MCQAPRFVLETPLRIVICEDDEQLGALVADILDRDGRFIVVGRALDGDEAVRLVERESPDVVLMDIGLPGRSGIEATRAIHERDSGQHVVIYTGSDEYDDIGRAAEAGAAGYLHKTALMSPDLPEALQVLHANYTAGPADE
jgi:DNA-binding NarL/FixJ family response regulator